MSKLSTSSSFAFSINHEVKKIKNCARCGGMHTNITFRELSNPKEYSHYSFCPSTLQPILMALAEPRQRLDFNIPDTDELETGILKPRKAKRK